MEQRFLGWSEIVHRPSGSLEVISRNIRTDEVNRVAFGSNLIVDGFRTEEPYILAGDAIGTRHISTMQLGTSGTPEQVTDGAITNPVSVVISSYSYPVAKSVLFEATLAAGVGNGVVFREAGLCHANGTLAARRVFPSMTKSSWFLWLLRWTIVYT